MTTMPSQVTGHPAPWMDLPASSTTDAVNESSDCENDSLVIDITPVTESDGEVLSELFKSSASDACIGQENTGHGLMDAAKDLAKLSSVEGCNRSEHGEKAMSNVVEIDPIVEGGMAEETVSKDVREATVDRRQHPMTGNIVEPSSGQGMLSREPKSISEATTQRNINSGSLGPGQEKPNQSESIIREGNSFSSEVSQVAPENAVQQSIGQDMQSEQRFESCGQPEVPVPSNVQASSNRVATGETINCASHVENRGVHRARNNLAETLDRTLISYLTDFPSRMRTLGTDPTPQTNSTSGTSVPLQWPTTSTSTSTNDTVRLYSTATTSSVTLAHKVTNASLDTPQLSPILGSLTPLAALPSGCTSDVQMVSEMRRQKRRHSPSSVIPVHVKEEKVDDCYEVTPQPATKVQVVDMSGGQRPITSRRHDPFTGSLVLMPAGNLGNCLNSLQSVVTSSAASALPSGRLRTMPTYRFSHFRTSSPKNIPTSVSSFQNSSSSLARFVSLYSQSTARQQGPHLPVIPAPVNPQYLFSKVRRAMPTAIQPKTVAATTQSPCFILVNRPSTSQITVATNTNYAIPASVPPPALRAKGEVASLSNGKSGRPLKVRPSNTNAALLTRKFEQLYKKSILPKLVSPKLMPGSLHVSAPLKTLACEGCGDEFITERGLNDHYARKSVVISFTCRCDKKVMLFYNMCSFARFYDRHAGSNSNLHSFKYHSSYDSCVMAMLPPYLMPPEYHRLTVAGESRRTPAEASVTTTSSTANGPAPSSTKTPSPLSAVTTVLKQPNLPVPLIKEFFNALESRNVNCSECPAVYKRRKSLAAHMSSQRSSVKGIELLQCNKCCMVLPNACSFRAHARIHDKVEPYVCPECGQTFQTSRDVFMKHIKKACLHFSRFQSRQCPVCSATLSLSAETMIAHLENAHAAPYHKCDSCTMAFPTEKSFHNHSTTQHNQAATSTAFWKCPICNATEKKPQSLAEHLGQHVKEDGFAPRCFFRCLFCLTSFSARPDFIEHMRNTHPDETIIGQMCNICGTICENGVALYGHTNAEHEGFLQQLLRADTNKTPSDAKQIEHHVASAEVKPPAAREAETGTRKSLECDRCQMVLSDDEQFKRHVAKHRFLEVKRAGAKLSEAKPKKKQRRNENDVADNNVQIKSEQITDETYHDVIEKKRRQARQRMRRYRERLSQDSKKRLDEENQNQEHLQPQPSASGKSASARYKARQRARETTPERKARLAANAQCQARRIARETTPQREARRAANARFRACRIARETTAQREARSQARRRARETTLERQSRLTSHSQAHERQRAQETLLKRKARLAANALCQARRRARETTLQRKARLAASAQYRAGRRAQKSTLERKSRLSSLSQPHERQRAQETTLEQETQLAANAQSQHQRRSLLTQEQMQHQHTLNNERRTLELQSQSQVPANPTPNQSTPIHSSQLSSISPQTVGLEKQPSECDKYASLSWFSCHLCEKAFKNTDDLHQHLKDTHTGKSRLHAYLCWICREQSELKSYPKAGMLIKHLKNFHKIARKNIDYARIASLDNKDDESVTGDEEKPAKVEMSLVRNLRVEGDTTYNCAKCEFSSAERDVFLEHIAKHRLNESHQCLECGICFVVLPSLKRHLFVVHRVRDFIRYQSETGTSFELPAVAEPDSDPDSFVSPNMDGRLSSVDAESSFQSETASTSSPEKESTLECTVCYRSFTDQWTLRQHMRVHGMAFIQGTRRNNMSRKSALSDS